MSLKSFIRIDLACPNCGQPLARSDGLMDIWWGYTTSHVPIPMTTYEMGDRVRWRTCNGASPAWMSFASPETASHTNVGDPALLDLVLLAPSEIAWIGEEIHFPCGQRYGGVAVEIRAGIFHSARVAAIGELDDKGAHHFLPDGNGGLVAQTAWLNHTCDLIDCSSGEEMDSLDWSLANSIQGGHLRGFYGACGIGPDQQFGVVPIPINGIPSLSLCP